jgi:hypothetical protein
MNAKPLFTEDKIDVVAYFCSSCRRVRATEKEAESCCTPKLCECGEEVKTHYTSCQSCIDKKRLKELKEKLSKAIRVTTPSTDYVYSECTGDNEGYFELGSIEEVFDDSELPFYVHDCDRQEWKGLDAGDLVNDALESDWYEDANDDVVEFEELNKFLETWNKKQNLHQFMATDRIIVLDEAKFNAWLNEQ